MACSVDLLEIVSELTAGKAGTHESQTMPEGECGVRPTEGPYCFQTVHKDLIRYKQLASNLVYLGIQYILTFLGVAQKKKTLTKRKDIFSTSRSSEKHATNMHF